MIGLLLSSVWRDVPLLALEGTLYEAELSWHERLDEGDAVDIQ